MMIRLCLRALPLVLLAWTTAAALTKDETKCVSALNKDGAAVGQQQGKENLACVKAAGKGQLTGTAQACLTADAKGLVAAKMQKTTTDEQKNCGDAPDFAYTDAGTVNALSRQSELDLVEDVFGTDLDGALATCATDGDACKCQHTVLNRVEKIAKAERSAFLKCKKTALKTADGPEDVAACIADVATKDSIAAARQPGGKVAKDVAKLGGEIAKKCDEPMVTGGAFPGACTGLSGDVLRDCLDGRLACGMCRSLGLMDGLVVDCDSFDDGAVNASCTNPVCVPGSTAPCYSGPPGTLNVGICTAGTQVCDASGTSYGACTGQVVPSAEVCFNGLDDDCDGTIDDGCIGDRAWHDQNANGLQDPGESGLGGATFILRTQFGSVVAVAVSAASGSYVFSSVPAGNYYIEVIPPFSYALTPSDVGSDDTIDNDYDAASGATDLFSFSGAGVSNIDCGMMFVP